MICVQLRYGIFDNEYIIFIKLVMFDLYPVIEVILGLMTLLNLIVLKLAVRDSVNLCKIQERKSPNYQNNIENMAQSPTKLTLKYMLLNFTPIEICATKRAKYKVSLFLSLSIIAISTYLCPSPYFFVGTGTLVYLAYFLFTLATTKQVQGEEQISKTYRQKYIQIILVLVSLALNFIVIGGVFKNYKNSLLQSFAVNFAINIALDNFVVRPLLVTLISLPLSRSVAVQEFIAQAQTQQSLLQIYEEIGEKEMLEKPGKMISPSKIPKRIPCDEVEPTPVNQQFLKKQKDEGFSKPIDLLKKIKMEHYRPPLHPDNRKHDDSQNYSLSSLFNSTKKKQQEGVQLRESIEPHNLSEQVSDEPCDLPFKNTKVVSDNLIMVNPSQQEPAQNEQDLPTEVFKKKTIAADNENECNDRIKSSKGETINTSGIHNNPLKITINSESNPSSRQQPLRICLNDEINYDEREMYDEEEEGVDYDQFRRRRETINLDDVTNKNNFGVLQIKEQRNHSEQIEEMDLNSPERKRRHGLHIELEEESKVSMIKKKKKKMSHDHSHANRQIKFSTGEPYLQYLPGMLTKDSKGKKSQAISKKEQFIDSRLVNSVRRPKKKPICIENNENIIPQFMVEDL